MDNTPPLLRRCVNPGVYCQFLTLVVILFAGKAITVPRWVVRLDRHSSGEGNNLTIRHPRAATRLGKTDKNPSGRTSTQVSSFQATVWQLTATNQTIARAYPGCQESKQRSL